ncbi:MAG TPA: hypothetical protein VK054_04870, partial [Beutenbergiaceae bacterium]|nr:hypothetical protein [Beutenbergiaceae bacterium]
MKQSTTEQALNAYIDYTNEPIILCGEVIPASQAVNLIPGLRQKAEQQWLDSIREQQAITSNELETAIAEAAAPYRAVITEQALNAVHARCRKDLAHPTTDHLT